MKKRAERTPIASTGSDRRRCIRTPFEKRMTATTEGPCGLTLSAFRVYPIGSSAELAQLVERNLAKVEVAGSSPVFRSFKTAFSANGVPRLNGVEVPTESTVE